MHTYKCKIRSISLFTHSLYYVVMYFLLIIIAITYYVDKHQEHVLVQQCSANPHFKRLRFIQTYPCIIQVAKACALAFS